MEATAARASYRALFHVPGFQRLAVSTLLVRACASMWQLALVLFVLQRYGSPSLAGLSVFLAIAPGVLVGPLAGGGFAVSMHLNCSGIPVGSALSGPLLAISTPLALTVAVAFAIAAAALTFVMVPSTERG